MKVEVFSINKFKSERIKRGNIHEAMHPLSWVIYANNCEVHNGLMIGVNGIRYSTCRDWNSEVDEKYVRRRYDDLH